MGQCQALHFSRCALQKVFYLSFKFTWEREIACVSEGRLLLVPCPILESRVASFTALLCLRAR